MRRYHRNWFPAVLLFSWLVIPGAANAQSPNFSIDAPISIEAGIDVGVQAIAVADVTKDGRPDIVVVSADEDGGPIAILLNQGNGVFGAPQFVNDGDSVLTTPIAVAVADFGAVAGGPDRNPDILVAEPDGFTVLFGNGEGGFALEGELTEVDDLDDASGVAVGDFDKVNGPDFAIIDIDGPGDNGQVFFFCNQGQVGLFLPCSTTALDTAGQTPVDVGTGDFNNDGNIDVVVLNEGPPQAGDGSLTLFLGNGDGSFTQPRTGVFPIVRRARDLVVANLNPDEDTIDDVAVASDDISGVDNLIIFLGGTTGAILNRSGAALELGTTTIAAGNFASNDRPDIAGVNDEDLTGSASIISISTGDGGGTFANPLSAGVISGGAIALASGRLNDDALDDLVILDLEQTELRIAINNTGSATRTPTITPTAGPPTPTPTATSIPVVTPELADCTVDLDTGGPQVIVRGDFNGDRDENDLAVLDPTAGRLLVLVVDRAKLTGDKADCSLAVRRQQYPLSGTFTSLASADLDHDGRTDLVVGGDSGLKVLFGTAGGTLSAPQEVKVVTPAPSGTPTPGSTPRAHSVTTGNFNRDGREDLGVLTEEGLLILTGMSGRDTFCQRQVVPMDNAGIVVAAKLDSTGFIDDLAVASAFDSDNAVTILLSAASTQTDSCTAQNLFPVPTRGYPRVSLGSASGKPTSMVPIPSSSEVETLLVSAETTNNLGKIFVIRGGNDGTFTLSTTIDVNGRAQAVGAGDFIGRDGLIDIVSAFPSGPEGQIPFFPGKQDGTFGSAPDPENVGRNPSSLVIGHFDNDGHLDLAVVNSGDGSLTFFLTSRVPPTPTPTVTNTSAPTNTPTETSTPGPTSSPTLTPLFTVPPTGTPKDGTFTLSSCSIAPSREGDVGSSIALLLGGIVVMRLRRLSARNSRR